MGDNKNKREILKEKIQDFCLMDDNFLSSVFDGNIECTELILRIILNNPDIKVREVRTQREIKNLRGHSIRLDIEAKDENGRPIDIEVQRADSGANVKRARYNSSLMDANTLMPGEDYDSLPESYVIFITANDVMGAGLALYHADRVVAETGKPLGDGTHIIYVNGSYRDDSPIGKLMYDFSCKKAADMHYKVLADKVRYYKEDAKGVEAMCQIMEDLIADEKKEMIIKMKASGKLSDEEIAGITGFTVEQVETVIKEAGIPIE